MVTNRRNHYRLLQVQPDAVPEVIKAAYRALITLHHPDTGGDHTTAVLINEAYSVLSDATRRAAYDAERAARSKRRATSEPVAATMAGTAPSSRKTSGRGCPMCGYSMLMVIRDDARCVRCGAPLAPVAKPGVSLNADDRRGIPRVSKSDWGTLRMHGHADPIDVRMRDLSPDGVSVYCGKALPVGRRVRITNRTFDIVADVVSCRKMNDVYTLHAKLVTAIFTVPTGGFMSRTA